MSAFMDRASWFGTPLLVTVLLHALLAAAMMVRFTEVRTIEARRDTPVAIKATLVSPELLKPKPKQKPPPKPILEPAPKPAAEKKTPTTTPPAPQPKPEVKPEPAEEVSEPDSTLTEADLAAITLRELEAALASDTVVQEGATGSLAETVTAIIKQSIVNRWTRPPSARNGMRAVLEIALVPTGDVVGVSVLESSGNAAFDRSAINAVEKVARFPEVKELERAVFERDFRRLQLIFRPEDLRY